MKKKCVLKKNHAKMDLFKGKENNENYCNGAVGIKLFVRVELD